METMPPVRRLVSLLLLGIVPPAAVAPCLCAMPDARSTAGHGCCEEPDGWVPGVATGCCDVTSEDSAPATASAAPAAAAPASRPAPLPWSLEVQVERPLAGHAAGTTAAPTPLRI
jgi:hypothetical protein